jgi:hypothetical protein
LNSCEISLCDTDYSVLLDRYNEVEKNTNVLTYVQSSSNITDNYMSDNESMNSKNSINSKKKLKKNMNNPIKEKKIISKKLKKNSNMGLKIKKTQYGINYKDRDIIVNKKIFNQLGYRSFMEKFLFLSKNDNIIIGIIICILSFELCHFKFLSFLFFWSFISYP